VTQEGKAYTTTTHYKVWISVSFK